LFELVINPSRYQLNDVVDYEGDQRRGHHWQRPVNKENILLVVVIALSRFILGTTIAFILDIRLGYIAIALLTLQLLYDHFAKNFSPFLAVFTVALAYPIRSISMFYGLKIELNNISGLLLLSIFFYSAYMVIQWRKYESIYITVNKLSSKTHSDFFSSHIIEFLNSFILLALVIVFVPLVVSLLKIDAANAVPVYVLSTFFAITLLLCNKNILNKIFAQSHNILISLIFLILTQNKYITGLTISWFSIFVLFWYHRIYVERFADNYFTQTHYEKR